MDHSNLRKIKTFEKVINTNNTTVLKVDTALANGVVKVASGASKMVLGLANVHEKLFTAARYLTLPFNKIIRDLQRSINKDDAKAFNYLLLPAMHYVTGTMGAGKTSLVFYIQKLLSWQTGKNNYTNSPYEKIKYDELTGTYYTYSKLINLSEFYSDYEVIKVLNSKYFVSIAIDELGSRFNRRRNQTNEYMSVFIPLLKTLREKRHIKIDHVFFLNQSFGTDNQLLELLEYNHEPKIDLADDFIHWLKTGKFRKYIRGWWIDSYKIVQKGNDRIEREFLKRWYLHCEYHMDDFDTYAARHDYDGIVKDFTKFI